MKVLTNNQYYSQIANVIREQNGTNNTYKPPQMVNALKDLFYEEVEGVPSISFNGIGENLLDYRIDGASGGVGERTINIFDGLIEQGTFTETGLNTNSTTRLRSTNYAPVNANTIYTLSLKSASDNIVMSVSFYSINDYVTSRLSYTNWATTKQLTFTTPNNCKYIRIIMRYSNNGTINISDVYDVQINEGSEALLYEPYGYKVPVVISGKNLFDGQFESGSGISSGNNRCRAKNPIQVEAGKKYTLSHTITNDFYFVINSSTNKTYPFDSNTITICGNSITWKSDNITFSCTNNGYISIVVRKQDNSNIYPDEIDTSLQIMFEESSTPTDYEPYHEPTTTNIYLDEPIEANESISLSDTNTNIPTIRGTNVLTVDTTVQPSNVYVKSRKESQYETAMRENYEQELSDIESALEEV